MYFVIFATDKPGTQQARNDVIDEFRTWLDDHPDHPDVVVHHGGPTLDDEAQSMNGTLNVIEAPSPEAARAFAADSPLRKAGVYGEFHVRQWDWRKGHPG